MGDKEETKKGDSEKPRKQKVLFLSDAHIAGKTSNFSAYQARIIELMTGYDHVCLLGDDWELFFVDKDHVKSMSNLLEVLTDRSTDKWARDFQEKVDEKAGEKRTAVENVIRGGKWFTSEFLERFPNVHLYKVEGNHEKVRRFRNVFRELQEKYPNFEWSTHGIRLGDALLTHGHIPMEDVNIKYKPARLQHAQNSQKWAGFVKLFAGLEHTLEKRKWNTPAKKQAGLGAIEDNLTERTGRLNFIVSHNCESGPLETMSWVKHIFFGHTHVKLDNVRREGTNTLFHNTGAIVKDETSRNPEDLGILEADLEDGKISNVRPVKISRDPDIRSRYKPSSNSIGR